MSGKKAQKNISNHSGVTMYLYKIATGTYDIYDCTELAHTRKIGKKEFNNMVVESILELLLDKRTELSAYLFDEREGIIPDRSIEEAIKILENKDNDDLTESVKQGGLKDIERFISSWCKPLFIKGGDVANKIVFIMMENYGFKRVEYEHHICFDYFTDIVDPDRAPAEQREQSDISYVIMDRVRKKYWNRIGKRKIENVKITNEAKIKKVKDKATEIRQKEEDGKKEAAACAAEASKFYAKDVDKFNKER